MQLHTLKRTTKNNWSLRSKGSSAFVRSFGSAKPTDKDFIDLTFSHPAKMAGVLDPHSKDETCTPYAIPCTFSVRIYKYDLG